MTHTDRVEAILVGSELKETVPCVAVRTVRAPSTVSYDLEWTETKEHDNEICGTRPPQLILWNGLCNHLPATFECKYSVKVRKLHR